MVPETKYARSGDLSIAYQVVGDGARDVIMLTGFASHVEFVWTSPRIERMANRLASFSRLIMFDKRGTGMSDPVPAAPTLEERMDDARAVLDAVGSERAVLFGISEGVPTALLFAATYPSRVDSLILYGGMARSTWAEDYPWATPRDDLMMAAAELLVPTMDAADDLEVWAPSLADDPAERDWFARHRRHAGSPGMFAQIFQSFLDIDVRHVLPTIDVPTLVLHRRGDRVVNRRASEWMAGQIPGARYVELPGQDHTIWASRQDEVLDHIQEFLTGSAVPVEPERVLATVMFTDIVGSTERAAELGDQAWRRLLTDHDTAVRRQLERFRGVEIKTLGDGFLATFDGPARAIRCGAAIREALHALDIEVRVGLHTGEVELIGDDVGGVAVNTAARVGALAAGSEVLVSRTVKDLVAGSGITFVERGTHELKGVPGPWELYAAVET